MASHSVERYGIFDAVLRIRKDYANPYRDVEATAELTRPDGSTARIPLFYEDHHTWHLRVSPDQVGTWGISIDSSDPSLDGATAEFECVPSLRRGGIQPMTGYPYHFEYQDGTPMWWFGDTNWRAFATDSVTRLNRQTVMHYLDVRSAQGFNYIHVDIMGGAGIDNEQIVFRSFVEEEIHPPYFEEVDLRLRYMNEKGITVGLALAWHRGPASWDAFTSEEACLRYARYIVARYSAYNVVFIVSGEWDQIRPERKPLFQAIGREIMANDPHGRMRAIHPCLRRTVEEFADEEWMSFGDYQQRYEAPHERESTAEERCALHTALRKTRTHDKPVVNAEYGYYLREMGRQRDYIYIQGIDKPHSHSRASFRRATWALTMAGGYFVTGFGTTYFGGWRNIGGFDVDAEKNDEAEEDLINIRRFWRSLDWWTLDPASDLVNAVDGGIAYCLAQPNCTYVVYCEEAETVELDLADADGSYVVRCFDPRTGQYDEIKNVRGGKTAKLKPPDVQDWAFVLTSTDLE